MKRTHNRTLYVSSAAAVVLLVGGPVAAAAASTATTDAARTAPAVSAALQRAGVDAGGAASAALQKYPGTVESLDKDGSIWHVNVIGKNGGYAEVIVDGATGSATVGNTEQNNDNGDEYTTLLAAKYNAQQAMKAALVAHPGTVWSVNWENDDNSDNGNGNGNSRYWGVEIKNGGRTTNVHVDPTSGKVTTSNSDSNNDYGNNSDNSDENN
ncbi:PepSY domain-containing protein [Streptomyces sp. NBC_00503]|uniref:PepSY domain-containing protein n=1 Tax=Streptomyces sp. NBC_00503 TaxID=2903659 RepID=UPI002E817D27|nr:PepSY domain-containing protein [Streptomyces sp. NBC_00503]WUD83657.1 PepSY domain-containing protein [Streptomyces sp. NBC_00503]